MLTQTVVAEIPLLLHERPDDVLVVGLGTGVTAGAAASHPVKRLDVVEISPEIVEASRWFDEENRRVLADPRVRLIVGDARSHLALSSRTYDVIISQPSNPWLAGAAALFTEESFRAVRARLAPGGIASQWLHTYDMSEADFRSIVATFRAVFPEATLWTIGESDMLLVAAATPLAPRLNQVERAWTGPAVEAGLARVGATDPFAVVSLWAGGPRTLARLAAGAQRQSDDRMALEFTAPAAAYSARRATQAPFVRKMLDPDDVPPEIRRLDREASALQWAQRAKMFERARLFKAAVADYARALERQPLLPAALDGLALIAVPAGEVTFAMEHLSRTASAHPHATGPRLAQSRLFAVTGDREAARSSAEEALAAAPPLERRAPLERLAELHVEASDRERLERLLPLLDAVDPPSDLAPYYRAVSLFMQGRSPEAVVLTSADVSRRPTEVKAWNLHGAVLASLGRHDEARAAFETARRVAPADAAAYTSLGFLDLELERPAEARHWFATAVALNPTSTIAHDGLRRSGAESR
jgi:tetratricopeptide (TPR) repeat protein